MKKDYYSDEVQYIMNVMPSFIVRWGVFVIFLIFVAFLVSCYYIKYPDIISAKASISTINPPTELIAEKGGLIECLYVSEGSVVEKKQIIGVLKSTAEWRDVETVLKKLEEYSNSDILLTAKNNDWVLRSYKLGELQSSYSDFQELYKDFIFYISANNIGSKIQLLEQQIVKNREYYHKLKEQGEWLSKEVKIEKNNLHRDSMLLNFNTISLSDYESSNKQFINKQYNQIGFDANLIQVELQILQNKQQIVELNLQQSNEIADYKNRITKTVQKLIAEFLQWEKLYIFQSPINGKVTFGNFWATNQHISAGQKFASIIPNNQMKIIGKVQVPSSGIGKIKKGQIVNFKLSGFPFMEYGILKGKIISIGKTPERNVSGELFYTIDVGFLNGLVTTYNKKLPLIQQMDGIAEIVVEDIRLIHQFVKPIKSLL